MKVSGISIFTGRPVEVRFEGNTIIDLRDIGRAPGDLPYIAPAFLDMQVNGYRGMDYSSPGLKESHVRAIIQDLSASGTALHIPTIVTGSQDMIIRNLALIVKAMDADPLVKEAIPGFHIEGPYISGEDGPRGAHDRDYVRDPSCEEFEEWQKAASGQIKIVTVAPERRGAIEFIRYIKERGVTAAIGHTAADPGRIAEAVAAGARLSTHLGNGSHAALPRLKNYIWEQLACDELCAGIIADGFHLPASVVKVVSRVKGLSRIVLVSDVAPPGGNPAGVHKWNAIDVEVFPDGHLGLFGTPFLAGAGHLLDWTVPHFMGFSGSGLAEAIRLCTVNPGRIVGYDPLYGTLSPGAPAHVTLFDYAEGGAAFSVRKTICGGRVVFEKGADHR
jgi:N-acetylglucosamine-6-phosphate deacetylase